MSTPHTDQYWCDDCCIEASYKKRPPGTLNVYTILEDGSRVFLSMAKAVTA